MIEVRLAAVDETADAVSVADDADNDADNWAAARRDGGALARTLRAGPKRIDARGLRGARLAAFVEGLVLGGYRFTRATSTQEPPGPVELCGADDADALALGLRRAGAVGWVRELANTRSNEKTPAWLAGQARDVLGPLGVDVVEHDVDWLTTHRFGGVLAVGSGSAASPRLIEASWSPAGRASGGTLRARTGAHIVLVGKGITFDTGGLDRKVGPGMNTMFTDMAGGAAVLGALRLVAEDALPIRVTALVPAAENSVSGAAYRPGDVIRHYGGRTIEITNTDAEGRMVLADALAYAVDRLRPTAIADIATLTGAAKIALGVHTGGLFATSDSLAAQLVAAGAATGEPLWRLPLLDEAESALDSSIADAVNSGGNPGAITAALFLRAFVGDVPWAHLDVAGPARAARDDADVSRGATGFGARLLHRWIADQT